MTLPATWVPRSGARPHSVGYFASRQCLALLLALAALFVASNARAHAAGSSAAGCGSCHSGGQVPTVLITADLTTINPGQLVNVTVSVSPTNGNAAGFYLQASVGTFSIVDSGTRLFGNGVSHSAPRVGSGGPITFKVGWTAPAAPGGVDFTAWGNSVNNDRSDRGDADAMAFASMAFGCAGTKYYHDYDGDGVGAVASGYTMSCSVPQYYSAKIGDCNDNDPKQFPGNMEVCDGKDNDCNGQVDDGLANTAYCTDADGDGHGVFGKAMTMGCANSKGFGLCDNDCNDNDPTVYPGAPEVCNNKDDNCNGRIDENARMVCGIGWCARFAEGCTSNCTPGAPRAEECNDYDDDCDGVKDNGTDLELCGAPGLTCKAGYCVSNGAGSGGMSSASGGSSGSTSSSAGSPVSSSGGAGSQTATAGAGNGSQQTAQAPAPGCSFGFRLGTWPPLAASGALLALAALRRRKRRN